MRSLVRAATSAVALLVLSSCTGTKMVQTWRDPAFEAHPVKRIFIACFMASDAPGVTFENTLAQDVSVGEVEGIGVRSCGMEFVADRLAGIFCITDGKENSQRMVEYLESRFGPPSREGPRALHWFSRGTHISFDGDEQGNGYVYCYSRQMFSTPPRDR